MWRSLLFVPMLEERFVAKAADRSADAVVLDLEASVSQDRKAEARAAFKDIVARLAPRVTVTVRINPLWTDAIRDLETCAVEGVSALHLALCRGSEDVRAVDGILSDLERERGLEPGGIRLVPMLESPGAVLAADEIAGASPRVVAMTLGVEDYATEMGVAATPGLLRHAAFQVIQAARAKEIAALVVPHSMADFRDLEGLEEAASFARSIGGTGGYAVHPDQVGVLNRIFSPSADERAWAVRVLGAAEQADLEGSAVFKVDGQMIDLPLITRARNIARAVDT